MTQTHVPTAKPPAWANRMMCRMLRTPGLQSWLGRSVAMVTFTGRRSGRTITIPVSYTRRGNTVMVLTKTVRHWWRNFAQEPAVRLRLRGQEHTGTARAIDDTEERKTRIAAFLRQRTRDARAYGVGLQPDKTVPDDELERLAPQLVPIEITLD